MLYRILFFCFTNVVSVLKALVIGLKVLTLDRICKYAQVKRMQGSNHDDNRPYYDNKRNAFRSINERLFNIVHECIVILLHKHKQAIITNK